LVLLWGIVVGIGTGLTAMVLAATVATRWFNHRRGLVMGILAASSATGQLLFLPVIAEFTTCFGWRTAVVLVAAALGATGILVLAFMRDRPSDRDLPLYGETAVTPAPASSAGFASLLLSPLVTLRDCARAPIFWVLFGTFFVCGCSTNGLIQTHFVALCHDYGLAATTAASVARHDGRVRFRRNDRLRLAVGPLRQSLAPVLVLRSAWTVLTLFAVHRFHALWPVTVRGFLRP
jgi:hypothetical protein